MGVALLGQSYTVSGHNPETPEQAEISKALLL